MTSVPSAAFEPATQAIERLQTYALYRTATGNGHSELKPTFFKNLIYCNVAKRSLAKDAFRTLTQEI